MKTLWQLLMKKKSQRTKRKHQNDTSQKADTEKTNLIPEDKYVGIDEVIKRNAIINNSLKSQI